MAATDGYNSFVLSMTAILSAPFSSSNISIIDWIFVKPRISSNVIIVVMMNDFVFTFVQ